MLAREKNNPRGVVRGCRFNLEPRRQSACLFQGKALHHNTTQGIIISNQSLVLQKVDRRSAGNYTCVGHNTEGDGESSPFYLNVMCTYDPAGIIRGVAGQRESED
jgi:hypothetical protein